MGFWDKIFHKSAADEWKKQQAELENWSDMVYTRKDLDMNDPVQRRDRRRPLPAHGRPSGVQTHRGP